MDGNVKFYYKWWFQFLLIPAFIICIIIWIKVSSPIHKVNKLASSIDVYSKSMIFNGDAYHSPLTASAAFYKAIEKEDVKLLKRCTTLRELYDYSADYHNNQLTDSILKQDLHNANEAIKKEYGNNWYEKLKYIEYGTDSSSGEKVYIYKLYYGNQLFKYNSFVFKIQTECYITSNCLSQYLINFSTSK